MHLRPPSPRDYESLERFEFRSERAWDDTAAVSDMTVTRVMLLGDIHNSSRVLAAALHAARDKGCGVLVQVGDFWLQDSTWRGFTPAAAELMWAGMHSPIPVVVVDGNHEAWPCLTRFLHRPESLAALRDQKPLHLGGSLWWADRGSTWTWANRRFGALGGTVSPDKWIPAAARFRWDDEVTTQDDLDRLIDNAPEGLDVLVCHDAPAATRGLVSGLTWAMPTGLERRAEAVRDLLQAAVDATMPSLVFHGHWHQRNRCSINRGATEVIGLAADGDPGCAAVLSVSDLQAHYVDIHRRAAQGRLDL